MIFIKFKNLQQETKILLDNPEVKDINKRVKTILKNKAIGYVKTKVGKSLKSSTVNDLQKSIIINEFLEKKKAISNCVKTLNSINFFNKETSNCVYDLLKVNLFDVEYKKHVKPLYLNLENNEKKINEILSNTTYYINSTTKYFNVFVESQSRGGRNIPLGEHMNSIRFKDFEREQLLRKMRYFNKIPRNMKSKTFIELLKEVITKYTIKILYVKSYKKLYERILPKWLHNLIFSYLERLNNNKINSIIQEKCSLIVKIYIYTFFNILLLLLIFLLLFKLIKQIIKLFSNLYKYLKTFLVLLYSYIKRICKNKDVVDSALLALNIIYLIFMLVHFKHVFYYAMHDRIENAYRNAYQMSIITIIARLFMIFGAFLLLFFLILTTRITFKIIKNFINTLLKIKNKK